ncbi:hypothetical protein LUZ62_010763 [Rhynchospora pubera]|uniref:PGG domain-containing protein n=1 Tax=Rhynchospora pubera TaxID=906938 RepID=A0AAV8AUA3_9POAL|nr:hypothetical protein LUZ62_010763 [Rhynchospora pubera]
MASPFDQSPQNTQQFPTNSKSSDDGIHTTETAPPCDESLQKELRKELFRAAMNREWKKLLELYKNKQVQNQKITRSKDTVLHVAMSGAPEYTVLKLLEIVCQNNSPEEIKSILGSENDGGDTTLHLAASLGLEVICYKITEMCPELVTTARNKLQETPLFTAVHHGKTKTFFVLEAAIHKQQGLKSYKDCLLRDITHCRRSDGSNILHSAIIGRHFGLAYEIIYLYPELVNCVNSRTNTEKLKLKFNFQEKKQYNSQQVILKDKKEPLPVTYKTCVELYSLLKEMMSATFNTVASSLRIGICKACCGSDDEENQAEAQKEDESRSSENQEQRRRISLNYDVPLLFLKNIIKLLLVFLGSGRLQKIEQLKQTHRDALKIMEEMVDRSSLWEYIDSSGRMKPPEPVELPELKSLLFLTTLTDQENTDSEEKHTSPSKVKNTENDIMTTAVEEGRDILKKILEKLSVEAKNGDKKDTVLTGPDTRSPVLIAAMCGITEMVKRILETFPVALLDEDADKKNIVLLAAEHRQVHVYNFMLKLQTMKEQAFRKLDYKGNSILHLAAAVVPNTNTGVALQMQREIKWYKYVANSMDENILTKYNYEGRTAEDVFTITYEAQFKESREWLNSAANSFSVVATLIVTIAYMASSTVPGGFNGQSGFPIFQNDPDFQVFTLASLIALCFAVAALITFLGIIIRPCRIWDFEKAIPIKLIFGFTCSIISIGAMLVSFCAGHSFTVEGKLRSSAFVLYGVLCIPVFFSIKWLSNLYTSLGDNLLQSTFILLVRHIHICHQRLLSYYIWVRLDRCGKKGRRKEVGRSIGKCVTL